MATVKPFKGLRPTKDFERIACPPYDVISSQEAREMAQGNPESFLHIDKPEIDLPEGTDPYSPAVYAKARENFLRFQQEGLLTQDATPHYYLYAQTMAGRTQYGLVAAVSTLEYDKGIIRKHELTRKDKELDRSKHVQTLHATTGPVFLTYPDDPDIDRTVAGVISDFPVCSFMADDGIRHTFWVISDPDDMAKIEEAFKKIPVLYIADGHHRSAAAGNVAAMLRKKYPAQGEEASFNYFLAVIFPASQLFIMDYNRLVKDLNGRTPEEFIQALKKDFYVQATGLAKPTRRHSFGMYFGGQWYTLTAKKESFNEEDPVSRLDVSILQRNVLQPLLNIGDPRTDKRIDFVGGIRGVAELERRVNNGEFKVAFSMYPTSIEELIKVADAQLIMPPKSTWFEPKLRSGLVVYKYNEKDFQ